MISEELKPSFSNLQLELLKLYANGVPDEQLQEIKWLLGKYFADKATEAMDKMLEEKQISSSDIIEQSKMHSRSAHSH